MSSDPIIRPFVTNMDRPVFALKDLPEEVVAVLFAYYSRSADGLRDNLRRLLAEGDVAAPTAGVAADEDEAELLAAREKARAFHEKWVVGYGHSSVAEHAIVHLALEDVSILASKVIEDARLASFTEKSTRYVVFDESKYYTPPSLSDGPLAGLYAETCRHLLGTYARLMDETIAQVQARRPRAEKQTERGWNAACKAGACDILRYLLPASTLTNIGMTANARTLERLITKMASEPLEECVALAEDIKREAQQIVPTLIKYADRSVYLSDTAEALETAASESGYLAESRAAFERASGAYTPGEGHLFPPENSVRIVRAPEEPDIDLAAALLYEHTTLEWEDVRQAMANQPPDVRAAIIAEAVAGPEHGGRRGRFDQPLRALEHLYYTFEILVDYGAFRDIQRHRMATQTRQRLTTDWGYALPAEVEEFGLAETFHDCMERAASAYRAIAEHDPHAAQYVLPMAYRIRVLFTWNLRELHHFISLRSSKQGHISYRHIAQEAWRALAAIHPHLAEHIRVDLNDYSLARA